MAVSNVRIFRDPKDGSMATLVWNGQPVRIWVGALKRSMLEEGFCYLMNGTEVPGTLRGNRSLPGNITVSVDGFTDDPDVVEVGKKLIEFANS